MTPTLPPPQKWSISQLLRWIGPTPATIVMRIILIVVVLGTLAIITAGVLSPTTTLVVSPVAPSTHNSLTVGLQVGDAAPNFTLTDLHGKRVSLSDFRGQPIMLNFWYATCPGCQAEMSGMQQYYASQQAVGKPFVILAINTVDDAQTARQFAQAQNLTYPLLLDDNIRVSSLYNLAATPTSYFIDRRGIIRSKEVGPLDENALRSKIAEIN
ncbi:MAG TPA: peroxiredoxin family protein [Ktedonosporobacter sp.]|nr:peroxiredoxin family protein [Ktedonosporobacter sp.]